MSRKCYVLLPGAWHGAWCFEEVVRLLRRAGHCATALDLPGCRSGELSRVTLQDWVSEVTAQLERVPDPAILVGHSRAGVVLSELAEQIPQRLEQLVYVSGFLLESGQSVLRTLREAGDSPFLRRVSLHERTEWLIDAAAAREMFYGDLTQAQATSALAQLGREPAAPLMTALKVSAERFGSVPRRYIECLRDTAIPLALQRSMQARLPCARVSSVQCGHVPFLSDPAGFAQLLLDS